MNQKVESDGSLVLTLIGKVNAGGATLTNCPAGQYLRGCIPTARVDEGTPSK